MTEHKAEAKDAMEEMQASVAEADKDDKMASMKEEIGNLIQEKVAEIEAKLETLAQKTSKPDHAEPQVNEAS